MFQWIKHLKNWQNLVRWQRRNKAPAVSGKVSAAMFYWREPLLLNEPEHLWYDGETCCAMINFTFRDKCWQWPLQLKEGDCKTVLRRGTLHFKRAVLLINCKSHGGHLLQTQKINGLSNEILQGTFVQLHY